MSLEPRALSRSVSVAVATPSHPGGDADRDSPAGEDGGVAGLAAEITSVLTGELDRYYDEWRRLFATMHETLSPLGRLCETASRRKSPQSVPALYPLLERLTEAAAAEAQAAAAQARDAAETKAADAQAALGRLETELQNARGSLQVVTDALDRERAAWAGTRADLENARRDDQQAAFACRSELQEAREELDTTRAEFALVARQLEAERAERGRLEAALEAVQRALRFAESHPAAAGPNDDARNGGTTVAAALSGEPPPVANEPAEPQPVSPSLALVRTAQPASAEAGTERDEYARRLLHTVEAAYWAGLDGTAPGVKAVDCLTESLRQAREQFLGRSGTHDSEGSSLFKSHLMARLESQWGTAFGRHLGIAIYELYPTLDEGQRRSRAS